MVGGGPGAFIGDVHRKAALFDDKCVLAAGCFSRNEEKNRKAADNWGVEQQRAYASFYEMAEKEAGRQDGIDFAIITTPNAQHYPAVKAFLEKGISVACDKPFTMTAEESEELRDLARKNNCLVCITYTNTGYVAVKQIRSLIKDGAIGTIRTISAEYLCDWLAGDSNTNPMLGGWRMDPKQSGKTNSVGDIGTHIENTVKYMTGLKLVSLCASIDYIPGRSLDNNAHIMVKYDSGASGFYWCSQIAIGHDNRLCVRIFGDKGAIEWTSEECNAYSISYLDGTVQKCARGRNYNDKAAERFSRIPAGHPEGTYEAFANIYREFTDALMKKVNGETVNEDDYDYQKASDGLEGVRFVQKCLESHENGNVRVEL
jgi:predicted dehydrogenase